MKIIAPTDEYKEETECIAAGTWGSIHVAAHHELIDLRELPCFITVSDKQEVIGYSYYCIADNECNNALLREQGMDAWAKLQDERRRNGLIYCFFK